MPDRILSILSKPSSGNLFQSKMAIFLQNQAEDIEWIIWELKEEIHELVAYLSQPKISEELEKYKTDKRKKEFLCSKILLKELFDKQISVQYNKFGKPFILNSKWNISITHSGKYVAVARSKQELGIDIELISEKLDRTKHKYSSDYELKSLDSNQNLYHLALYWSGKESVYKLVGNEALIFNEEMKIERFIPENKGSFILNLVSSPNNSSIKINYQKIEDYVFTFCIHQ